MFYTRIIRSIAVVFCALWTSTSLAQGQSTEKTWAPLLPNQTVGRDGVFDPSLAVGDEGSVFLSFSAVNPNAAQPAPHDRKVSTYLASSTDDGVTWRVLNSPVNSSVTMETNRGMASWQHEVTSLTYDAQGNGEAVWRLMSHHYPLIKGRRRFEYGWIALKSANSFEGLTQAPEIKLFVGKAYRELDNQPVAGSVVLELDRLHKDLAQCVAFTEPGLLAFDQSLYLALNCAEFGLPWRVRPKVVLLACDRPCNPERPESWQYTSTLLSVSDAQKHQYKYYSAPDFIVADDGKFLVATPVSNNPFKDAYNGCDIFRFDDLAKGRLVQEDGRAKRFLRLEGLPASFNGACAVNENPALTLLSQLRVIDGRAYFDILLQATDFK